MSTMATLETLNFDNLALKSLPIDPEEDNFIRQVKYVKHRSLMQISHTSAASYRWNFICN